MNDKKKRDGDSFDTVRSNSKCTVETPERKIIKGNMCKA